MAEHNELGKIGEALAANYLRKKGYVISETNWRTGKLEIDIIAIKDDYVVFVEVKTRENNWMGEPGLAVIRKKQAQIVRAAAIYFRETGCELEARFDIIGIIYNTKYQHINHIEEAYYPLARKG